MASSTPMMLRDVPGALNYFYKYPTIINTLSAYSQDELYNMLAIFIRSLYVADTSVMI